MDDCSFSGMLHEYQNQGERAETMKDKDRGGGGEEEVLT